MSNSRSLPLRLVVSVVVIAVLVAVAWRFRGSGGGAEGDGQSKVEIPRIERSVGPGSSAAGDFWETDRDGRPLASKRVGEILADEGVPDREIRDRLLALARDRSAPAHERKEALGHGLMLTPDEDHGVILELLGEPGWPNETLDEFYDDAMNRPDPDRLVLLVEVMNLSGSSLRTEIRESLAFLLDQDPGEDIEAWREAVGSWSPEDAK